jgi:hypothetical protein
MRNRKQLFLIELVNHFSLLKVEVENFKHFLRIQLSSS